MKAVNIYMAYRGISFCLPLGAKTLDMHYKQVHVIHGKNMVKQKFTLLL